jgi:hypothetical protein
VAYVLEGARGKSIRLRRLDTSEDREILAPAAENRRQLMFSPSGGEIYYRQGNAEWAGNLYRLSLSGGAPVLVLENVAGSIAFAHDGQRLAFIQLYVGRWGWWPRDGVRSITQRRASHGRLTKVPPPGWPETPHFTAIAHFN